MFLTFHMFLDINTHKSTQENKQSDGGLVRQKGRQTEREIKGEACQSIGVDFAALLFVPV